MMRFQSFVIVFLLSLSGHANSMLGADVDWDKFLSRHDLVWEVAPQAWHDGPFLGNGMLGAMVHQLDDHTLRISLGRSDVEDHQQGGFPFISQSRLPNGFFKLTTAGRILGFEGRLDLYNAEVRATVTTDMGTLDLRGLVHSDDMVIAFEFETQSDEVGMKLEFVPLKAIAPARLQAEADVALKGEKAASSRKKWATSKYTYNPDHELEVVDGYDVCRQKLSAGGETATAWKILADTANRTRLLVSIEHSFPRQTAVADAVGHLKPVVDEPFDQFVKRHRQWWHAYYPKSFLSLDDARIESFYWIQVYKFGAGARKGRAFMDTMGPWIVENTAWANGWFNLNTQLSYWFLSTANRMEVADSLFSKLDEKLPTLVANMPEQYGGRCAGMATIVPQTFVSPFPKGRLGFTGELLWTCHDYWLMLERTMDHQRTQEKFFPLLKKSVNTYLHVMVEGDDGKIHLPRTRSPEYGAGEDCNFNLSLFRWGCQTLIAIDQRYDIGDPLLPKWKDVVERLVDYPTNENGYMVAKDFPFEKSHRHYSHLLMIYPLCEVNIDQRDSKDLIKNSVDHWINYPGTGNAGYSWSGAAAMYALQGDGEAAKKYVDIFMQMQKLFPKNPAKIHPTTMYTETPRIQPVTETPFSLCDSIQLMMLQSWGQKIRIFPAIPDDWQDISFDGFLAAGGFKVSAVRRGGETKWVQIEGLDDSACHVVADVSDPQYTINGKTIRVSAEDQKRMLDGRGLLLPLRRGEVLVIKSGGEFTGEDVAKPVGARNGIRNSFGLPKPR